MELKIHEVAAFYYRSQGNQLIKFDDFVRQNRRILKKISQYEFTQWSESIDETDDLSDALLWLHVHIGMPVGTHRVTTTRARYELLHHWEQQWGELPNKYRTAFIRSPKMKSIQYIDLDILKDLFAQHRKFDSVIGHIERFFRANIDLDSILNDPFQYFLEDPDAVAPFSSDSQWLVDFELSDNEEALHYLSAAVGIDIDWNLDDLDSETILFGSHEQTESEEF